ncbi:hypothetical protein FIV42_05770 [Persicimonas caeni]|uniref:Alpha-macroglobulin-like TED domain-containing protein n=1 Tax=Persicimonas caeni TaxID=2292766 RepID=A0A4Y6PPL5_PERCE|nr:hypothetical protein [Persicimonas caeni]QDG50254.1 hypothetical protein FIV42_05770 [Persicimonas caeni]QED31475.1 hypothetical protein FRD00_05765 [Persicimonas caeni]
MCNHYPRRRWSVAAGMLGVALALTSCSKQGAEQASPAPGAARAVAVEATAERERAEETRAQTIAKTAIIGDRFEARFELPDDVVDEYVSVTIELAPSPSQMRVAFYPHLVKAPMRGMMLTTYSNIPNALLFERLQTISPQAWAKDVTVAYFGAHTRGADDYAAHLKSTKEMLAEGYQKLLGYQNGSRGFTNEDGEITSLSTALGLLQLAALDEVIDIDAVPAMRLAADGLLERQQPLGHWEYDDGWSANDPPGDVPTIRSTAFAVWALSRAGLGEEYDEAIDRGCAALEKMVEGPKVAPYARALAANALLARGRRAAAVTILDTLAQDVQTQGDQRYWKQPHPTWSGNSTKYASVAATALVVRAFARAEVHADLIPGTVAYLDEQSSSWAFVRTDASIWAIDALLTLYDGLSWAPVTLTVQADGEPVTGAAGRRLEKLRIDPKAEEAVTLEAIVPRGTHTITVVPDEPTSVIATVTARFEVAEARIR